MTALRGPAARSQRIVPGIVRVRARLALMRLYFYAIVQSTPPWVGHKTADRPYSRVPTSGESVRLGEADDSTLWAVSHVSWDNQGSVMLTFMFAPDGDEFAALGRAELEHYGFEELVGKRPPID